MPYGMPKELGGDSKKNEEWMSACVTKVMKSGKDKGSAVAICKSTYEKTHGDKAKAEFIISGILEK